MRSKIPHVIIVLLFLTSPLLSKPTRVFPSLLFTNNITDKVDCGSGTSVDNLTAFTILVWVYRTTTLASAGLVSKGSFAAQTRNPNLNMRGNDGATPSLTIDRATTDGQAVGDNTADILPANTWAFVAATYDPTDGPRLFRGTLSAEAIEDTYFATPTVGVGTTADNSSESLVIGNAASGDTQNKGFPGRIGPLLYFNRRMALAEIRSYQFHFRKGSGCVLFLQPGFNGTGTQPDWSGNGNNGTVTTATVASHTPIR